MSEDPKLFDAGDYNLFSYCHNDPIDNVDPMGLDTVAIVGDQRDDSYNVVGYASMEMTGQGVFSQGTGTLKENWCVSARSFITRQSEHRQQRAFIIRTTAKQESAMRKSLEARRDKALPNVYRHPIDACNDNCSTRIRDALKAAGIDIGNVHTPQQLANALEGQAKDGQVEKLVIPAKSNLVPEQLKQFEPGAFSNRTEFQLPIDKKAQEHASDVIHSKPDPNPQ